MKFISQNIKRLRAYKELNQKDLAKLLNCTLTAVAQWETNINRPGLEKLVAMRTIFNVTLDELVCGEIKLSLAKVEEEVGKAK